MNHSLVITLFALGTVAMNVALVGALLGLALPRTRVGTIALIRRNALFAILMLALAGTAGSLYMQYGLDLAPCLFCWWQRIFLYPIVLISGVAAWQRTGVKQFADYVLALAIPGALVALYQHLLQMLPSGALIPCDAAGECAVRTVFAYGYITLPWMALSAFALVILAAAMARFARE